MDEFNFAPIVLFVYNRLDHTKKTIDGLLTNPEVKYSSLYIFADGPSEDSSEENITKIKEVQNYVKTIHGFKEVVIESSPINKGLPESTIYGVTKVINKYGKAIIMEDDDVPNSFFLSYVNKCLELYKNDSNIWCVSGYTDTNLLSPYEGNEIFLVNRPSSWGFGTWKRCWDKVIWDKDDLKGIFNHFCIIKGFGDWGGYDFIRIMFRLFDKANEKKHSWSIRYNFAAYLNNAYTILPKCSLIDNIGMDGSGIHTGIMNHNPLVFMDHDIVIPKVILFDNKKNKVLCTSPSRVKLSMLIKTFIMTHDCLMRIPFIRNFIKTHPL